MDALFNLIYFHGWELGLSAYFAACLAFTYGILSIKGGEDGD